MNIIINQFNYVKSCLNKDGQLIDEKLKAPLNFQYHYSSFILSSILNKEYKKIEDVLEYYFSIPQEIMKPSNEFNVLLLLFSILNDDDNILDKYKNEILKSIYHKTNEELYKSNNNFRALKLVGMILESKVKNMNRSQLIDDEINWILKLQFDDGFFPDSNMVYEVERNEGVPHLIYHTKIMMCIGIIYLYTKDIRLKISFLKAMKVLLDLSIDNYYFFYGRSTNALFGYGSLYMSFILAYIFSSDQIFLQKSKQMIAFLEKYQHNDGHISINLNKYDSSRLGFDGYMYDIVYNAYSNALFLLGNKILKTNKCKSELVNIDSYKLKIYKNSGFVVYERNNIKYCFNYKGHQDSLKHEFDSRVSPFSLLYYFKSSCNLLPSVGFVPQPILKLVETKFPLKKLYSRLYRLVYFKWLPVLSGNSFFYIRNNIKFYPYKCIKMIKLQNKIIMKFESKSREVFFKKNLSDFFVISINLNDTLDYKLIFYNLVDKLYYTYREIAGKQNFIYFFDKKMKQLSTLSVETSQKVSDLYRFQVDEIKQLNIKVRSSNEV